MTVGAYTLGGGPEHAIDTVADVHAGVLPWPHAGSRKDPPVIQNPGSSAACPKLHRTALALPVEMHVPDGIPPGEHRMKPLGVPVADDPSRQAPELPPRPRSLGMEYFI